MNKEELMKRSFRARQVVAISGLSSGQLHDMTRNTKSKRMEPVFVPSYPAIGKGHKDIYSFEDLVVLFIISESRKAGIERNFITRNVSKLRVALKNKEKILDLSQELNATSIIFDIEKAKSKVIDMINKSGLDE